MDSRDGGCCRGGDGASAAGCCCWSCPSSYAYLAIQYFSMKDLLLMGGRISFVGVTSTPIELAETCDQGWKSQCSIGLFWVHWVSRRHDTCKLVNDIRDKLGYMNTNLGHNSIDQLTFRQREIKIMVARKDVAEEKCHPDLCQGSHTSAHDPHPPSHHASCKDLSRGAQ